MRSLVTETEESMLRMLRLLIDRLNVDTVEIYNDLTISAYRMLVKDVFDKEKIFDVLKIPATPENLAVNSTYANMTVIFMVSIQLCVEVKILLTYGGWISHGQSC